MTNDQKRRGPLLLVLHGRWEGAAFALCSWWALRLPVAQDNRQVDAQSRTELSVIVSGCLVGIVGLV